MVGVSGGGGDADGVGLAVQAVEDQVDFPAGHFSDVVAASAGAAAVAEGGGSAVSVAEDVVEVADGGVAERIPAVLVAQSDQLGEPAVEPARVRVAANDKTPAVLVGGGEQSPPPFAAGGW